MNYSPHVLFSISPHGLGHFSQIIPVIDFLYHLKRDCLITVRTVTDQNEISRKITLSVDYEQAADDFGMKMLNALDVDLDSSLASYNNFHNDWDIKVADLASNLIENNVNLVVADIPYLSLAAAAKAGIPSIALCSLNWADVLEFFVPKEEGKEILEIMRAAYNSAEYFLQPTPSMKMNGLGNLRGIGPVCKPGQYCRGEIEKIFSVKEDVWLVLVGMGGMPYDIDYSQWPQFILSKPVYYIAPASSNTECDWIMSVERWNNSYSDLVASVDLVVTKPGYGMFVESAVAGVPVLYVERKNWPDVESLTDWLVMVAHCMEISLDVFQAGSFADEMTLLLEQGRYMPIEPTGNQEAALIIQKILLKQYTDANLGYAEVSSREDI